MSIVKMKRLRLIALSEERDDVLAQLLHLGCVEVTEPEAELLQSAVSKVRVTNNCVTVMLKNRQVIERRDQM